MESNSLPTLHKFDYQFNFKKLVLLNKAIQTMLNNEFLREYPELTKEEMDVAVDFQNCVLDAITDHIVNPDECKESILKLTNLETLE